MKNTIAALIAGLFATAAFAQTPAPAATSPAVKAEAKTDAKSAKAEVKSEAHETKKAVKEQAKETKAEAKQASTKAGHKVKEVAKEGKDATVAAVTPASATTTTAAK